MGSCEFLPLVQGDRRLLEKERQETREEGTKKEERGRERRRIRRRGTREVFEYGKKN